MHALSEALQLLAVAALGAFVGAMLTEGCVLVPYWRSLPPDRFFAWYGANDKRLMRFFGPVTAAAALLAIASAIVLFWAGSAAGMMALIAALLMIVIVAMFPLYFERANASFAAISISSADLPAELARWATWHWVRTALSVLALAAATLGLKL